MEDDGDEIHWSLEANAMPMWWTLFGNGGRLTSRVMPNAKKMFRFGDGEVKWCESYLLLPQHVGSKKVLLGIYTLVDSSF